MLCGDEFNTGEALALQGDFHTSGVIQRAKGVQVVPQSAFRAKLSTQKLHQRVERFFRAHSRQCPHNALALYQPSGDGVPRISAQPSRDMSGKYRGLHRHSVAKHTSRQTSQPGFVEG